MPFDNERLRADLRDYYGTAMFNGNPMAMMELEEVERASGRELQRIASNNGFDLDKYETPSYLDTSSSYSPAYEPSYGSSRRGTGVGFSSHSQTISSNTTQFFSSDTSSTSNFFATAAKNATEAEGHDAQQPETSSDVQPEANVAPQPEANDTQQPTENATTQPEANERTSMAHEYDAAADAQLNSMIDDFQKRVDDAESDFEFGGRMLEIKTSRTISDLQQLADIIAESNRITDELYASYESLVRSINAMCKPIADRGVSAATLRRVVKLLSHINSECSTLGANFSASVDYNSLGNIASTRYSPTMEARMIESNWKTLLSIHPEEIAEQQARREREEIARKEREEREAIERAKAIEEYPQKLAEWEAETKRVTEQREKEFAAEMERERKNLMNEIKERRNSVLKRAHEEIAAAERTIEQANATIKGAKFLQFGVKIEANQRILEAQTVIGQARASLDDAEKEYANAMARFETDLAARESRVRRRVEGSLPLPSKPRDPNGSSYRSSSTEGMTAIQIANEAIKEEIYAAIEELGTCTISDLMEYCPACADISNQRCSALVRQLVTSGDVERFEEKRLAYFRIA